MTINAYYIKQGNKLILFTDNAKDFNDLNKFLLWIQQLGSRADEDVVPLKIIKSLPLKNQITIFSDFLFTRMPKLSWSSGGSVIGMLQDNGINLKLKEEAKSSLGCLSSSFGVGCIKSLFYGYKNKKLPLSTQDDILDMKLVKPYEVHTLAVHRIVKRR